MFYNFNNRPRSKYHLDVGEVTQVFIIIASFSVAAFLTISSVTSVIMDKSVKTSECIAEFSLFNRDEDAQCDQKWDSIENKNHDEKDNDFPSIIDQTEEKDNISQNKDDEQEENVVTNTEEEKSHHSHPNVTNEKYIVIVDDYSLINNNEGNNGQGKNNNGKNNGNNGKGKGNQGCNSKGGFKDPPKGNSANRNFRGFYTCFIPYPPEAFSDWELFYENRDPSQDLTTNHYHIKYFNKIERDKDRKEREKYCAELGGTITTETGPTHDGFYTNECIIHTT